jgi:hypothetical protein
MPFPNRPSIPRPGVPNQWDAIQEPDAPPDDPGTGSAPGSGCGAGQVPESIGADGNWRTAGPGECISQDEFNRRVDLNIRNNPNGGEPNAGNDPTGAGPQAPAGAAKYSFSPVPAFNAPQFQWNEEFRAPSYTEAEQDPGYLFRVNEGRRALEQSAAGRGTLRTGGTLKDIVNYGQNAASQEYGNVFDRYSQGYNTRFNTERDKYNFQYQGAKDQYSPKLFEWQTKTAFGTQSARDAWQKGWEDYWRNTLSASDVFNAGQQRG